MNEEANKEEFFAVYAARKHESTPLILTHILFKRLMYHIMTWEVFLTTDTNLEPHRILELYAMRWAIEVYFKEIKQYLGFLNEQSNHYAAYIASIHLTAIRFCMLVIAKSRHQTSGIADVRQQLTANATSIDYAARLWQVFRSVISGAMDEMKMLAGDTASQIMATIERHVQSFFVQALQLDVRTLRLETK
ncbi:transposase [Nitrosomonas sp.]|uniref:transposase n=1 Tax=Nitrosomonas sp. TaxID=42353 RepID=UPI002730B657|nr:transposase [Nitrosomonas sp.]MDP2225781.1 transposase [Nitrosomonas sp.]